MTHSTVRFVFGLLALAIVFLFVLPKDARGFQDVLVSAPAPADPDLACDNPQCIQAGSWEVVVIDDKVVRVGHNLHCVLMFTAGVNEKRTFSGRRYDEYRAFTGYGKWASKGAPGEEVTGDSWFCTGKPHCEFPDTKNIFPSEKTPFSGKDPVVLNEMPYPKHTWKKKCVETK